MNFRNEIQHLSVNELRSRINQYLEQQSLIIREQRKEWGTVHLHYPTQYPIEYFDLHTKIEFCQDRLDWLLDPKAQEDCAKAVAAFHKEINRHQRLMPIRKE